MLCRARYKAHLVLYIKWLAMLSCCVGVCRGAYKHSWLGCGPMNGCSHVCGNTNSSGQAGQAGHNGDNSLNDRSFHHVLLVNFGTTHRDNRQHDDVLRAGLPSGVVGSRVASSRTSARRGPAAAENPSRSRSRPHPYPRTCHPASAKRCPVLPP